MSNMSFNHAESTIWGAANAFGKLDAPSPAVSDKTTAGSSSKAHPAVKKVLIVEDLAPWRYYLAGLIQAKVPADVQVFEATDGNEAVSVCRAVRPDMVVMDISMPKVNGIKAARQIWAENPAMKILFWSQYHRETYVRELAKIAPDQAIHGYVLKSETDDKLVYAMNSVLLHDNPYIDPIVRSMKSRVENKDKSLTDIEFETLQDVALGLTDKAIAMRRHISVRGVQNRISALVAKMLCGTDSRLKSECGVEVYNQRNRIVLEAMKRGLIDEDTISSLDCELKEWMQSQFDVEAED